MKMLLIGSAAFPLLFLVGSLQAQIVTDVIQPYETTPGTCIIFDNLPGARTVTVYHRFGFALATRFKVSAGPDVTMVYVGETHYFANTLGDSQAGIQVCYGECFLPHDSPLVTINYLSFGTSGSCSEIGIVPHPDAETLDVIGCDGIPRAAGGGAMLVNQTANCIQCPPLIRYFSGTPVAFGCGPLAVETTTWGSIKALYR